MTLNARYICGKAAQHKGSYWIHGGLNWLLHPYSSSLSFIPESLLNICVVLRLPFSLSAFVSCRVVSGSRDATLRVWDIDSGQCLHVLMGHVAAVRCVQYDGRRVVSGAYDFMVKVWDPEMETCLHTLQGHTNRVYSLQVRPPTALKKRLEPNEMYELLCFRVFENSYKNILVYDAMNQMQLVVFRSIYVRTRLTTLL